ncbi:CHAD domain-containing protein [Paracoccus jiaweipingae]|uniref:CHAD domain-containing protein n=1 Tax=unclassified Paracoccus (in: a-proteobacteria) TaxID=2688777 RepID=UPI0037AF3130
MTANAAKPAAERGESPTAAALFAQVARRQAQGFDDHLRGLQHGDDPEHPHRARVALRRLRSALRGFAPILDAGAAHKLSRRARKLFRLLGPLREADVALAAFAGDHDRDHRRAHARKLRDRARDDLRRADAAGFAGLIAAWLDDGRLLSDGHAARRLAAADARLLAAQALAAAWTAVLVYGPDLAALDDETRHEFRKDIKTLRYLSEFFADLWPGTATGFGTRLEALQGALGDLNDITVHAAGAALDPSLQARFDSALADAGQAWQGLRACGPWWH